MGTCLRENAYPITMQHFQLKIDIIASKIGKNVECHRLMLRLTVRENLAFKYCYNIHVKTYSDMGGYVSP